METQLPQGESASPAGLVKAEMARMGETPGDLLK